ncbi:metaxin-3 isoform X2 [Bufo gargarizans]|uniref:metaxin-3 isoform X2 n=1 Tax=Bufo gargarizans TaxID=30331 RepID=UPI001CF39D12|nr:metaxin-3 isoform X2 [Bufo gargarizans]
MELRYWGGDWGLPSVHPECLVVLAYAKFGGAPLVLNPVDNTWANSQDVVPTLTYQDDQVTQPVNILNCLRKQKYNADYVLSAREGSDTLAYIALLEEKLLPAILHTFWVDSDNYSGVTRPWYASRIPFPLCFYLPGKMSREVLNRILVTKGQPPLYSMNEVEAQIYKDAKECLNLLSNRLGKSQFFFGDKPTTLDAFVFGFLAPLYKARLLKVQLQEHLKQLPNLCDFCDHILCAYFTEHAEGTSPAGQEAIDANLQKLTQLVNKESNLIEKMDDNLRRSPQNRPKTMTTLQPSASAEPRHSSLLLTP